METKIKKLEGVTLKNPFLKNGKTILIVTWCFSLTIIGFPIINSYLINHVKFQSTFYCIFIWAILLSLLISIPFSIILLPLKTSVHRKIISFITAVSLLIWFQGYIIVWQYGILDGRAILWNNYFYYGIIDTSIWILILILANIKASFFYRFAQTIATALILIQLISVMATYFQTPRDSLNSKRYIISENPKFNFSKEKNVILIVLDEFQSNIFQEIIAANDGYKSIFDGFVYFRNAVAPFSFTELSIPAILTGKFYDNSEKRSDFLKNSFLDNSIPKVLKENSFEVDLYPLEQFAYSTMYFDESICSNVNKSLGVKGQLKETLLLFDLSLFRYVPHFLKKYIYSDNQWFFSRLLPTYYRALKKQFNELKNRTHKEETFAETALPKKQLDGDKFIESAKLKSQFKTENNVFKFYHLWGVHVPLRINEKSEIVSQVEYNKENYTRQAKAYLEICEKFFDILKQEGAYDDCLIFVFGDHGSGRSEDMYVNPVYDSHNDALDKVSPNNNFQFAKARGIPLLLVKPFNSIGVLKISDAPVSLIDIPKTIISELEIKADLAGLSMMEIEDGYNRKRYYGAFEFAWEQIDFVKQITMYTVTGFSWTNESWEVLSVLPPKK